MPRLTQAQIRRQNTKEYGRLVAEANGEFCAICGNGPKTRRLHIDHDHKTGRIRGLLCFRCNRNLPTYATSEWLRKAADYLDGSLVGLLAGERERRRASA
jgi:Recombination endonuclease VII